MLHIELVIRDISRMNNVLRNSAKCDAIHFAFGAPASLFNFQITLAIVCNQVDADVVLKGASSSKRVSRTAGHYQ